MDNGAMDEAAAKRLLVKELEVGDVGLQFVRALIGAHVLGDHREAVVHLLEKPWHYATEFVAWDAAGRPMDHSEPGWDQFCEAVL